ncbi:MAG: hypothetical protein GY696_04030 [Gammaproteobacteria bacterium]|nr:hypothetical protein [Gammaproteobacteria bacterium]
MYRMYTIRAVLAVGFTFIACQSYAGGSGDPSESLRMDSAITNVFATPLPGQTVQSHDYLPGSVRGSVASSSVKSKTPTDSLDLVWGVAPVLLKTMDGSGSTVREEVGLGATAEVRSVPGRWAVGSTVSNVWSAPGSEGEDINRFSLHYFANYNLDDGWYLVTEPVNTANWKAKDGKRWTIPVGGGFGRILKLGDMPINVNMQAYEMIKSPEAGRDWELKLQFQLMFPK